MINMYNAATFLEEGRFVPAAQVGGGQTREADVGRRRLQGWLPGLRGS